MRASERPRVCVNSVILDKDKKRLLLLFREQGRLRDVWAFPGGKTESGETLAECALREAKEETGLMCRFVKMMCVMHNVFVGDRDSLCFFALLDSPKGKLVPSEEGKLSWFLIDELPENMLPTDRNVIKRHMDDSIDVITTRIRHDSGKITDFKIL